MEFFWSPADSMNIETFLKKRKPSFFTTDETPWIWAQNDKQDKKDPERDAQHAQALTEAQKTCKSTNFLMLSCLVEDLEARLAEIESDDSIPVRAKKGTKSKKQVRDEAHEAAKEELKETSVKAKWTMGKWMMFPRHADVDRVWGTIATSVAKGPLQEAGVHLAKVAPSRPHDQENSSHVICVYLADVYDLSLVRKVLETLLGNGIEPSALKSDLYTLAGIDSNHPTKLRSSLWRPGEVLEGGAAEVKKLLESSRTSKVGDDGIIGSDSEDERIEWNGKREAAPITSNEAGAKSAVPASKKVKGNKSAALNYQENDIFAGGSESEDD